MLLNTSQITKITITENEKNTNNNDPYEKDITEVYDGLLSTQHWISQKQAANATISEVYTLVVRRHQSNHVESIKYQNEMDSWGNCCTGGCFDPFVV